VGAVRRSVARAQSRRRVGVVQETSELGLRRRIDGSWSLAWILKWWKLFGFRKPDRISGFNLRVVMGPSTEPSKFKDVTL
jgi:hypothetical protein